MKLYIKISLLLCFVAWGPHFEVQAQQLERYTQYMFEPYLINPAMAGSKTSTPVMATYRNQWTGFKDAPSTFTLSAHSPLPNNLGVGMIIRNDKMGGAISSTGFDLTGSYKMDLSAYDAISFGLSACGTQYKFDGSSLLVKDQVDEALQYNVEANFIFDMAFGMMIYGKNYHFGLSMPHLLQSNLLLDTRSLPDENQYIRHYNFMGGFVYKISKEFDLEPSALVKLTSVTPVQLDVNAKLRYLKTFWGGLSYRNMEALAMMVGMEMNNFTCGYSYDFGIGNARALGVSAHEIIVGYYIGGKRGFETKSQLGGKRIPQHRFSK